MKRRWSLFVDGNEKEVSLLVDGDEKSLLQGECIEKRKGLCSLYRTSAQNRKRKLLHKNKRK